jgi:glycosyltransferase involved in cell wall biosynthesis
VDQPPSGAGRGARIVIAHDWLVRYAGSERCVEEMLAAFPDARVVTTLLRPETMPPVFRGARPSVLQHVPGATGHHEWLLPAMPLAWRLLGPVRDADALVSSSHACAKGMRAAEGIPHLCYCHTPMRYAWDFEAERERFPRGLRPAARAGMAAMRSWDRRSSRRVTRFLANSRAVADRIRRFYGRDAAVLHPPVDTGLFTPDGREQDGFLYVGRLVGYKRADLVVEAFAGLPHRLVVVGDGPLAPRLDAIATPNVTFRRSVTDDELRDLYRSARALVYPVDEDFGIVMAESQACGTPVIGLARGGAVDIVSHGRTGWLIREQTTAEVRRAVAEAATTGLDEAAVRASAERFSRERFRAGFAASVEDMIRDPRPA